MNMNSVRIAFLALLAAIVGCSGKKEVAASADAASGQTAVVASGNEAPPANANNLGALVDVIAAEANDLPRAEFDPAALARQLGKNPAAHFAWVRDRTWWAPYRGLLRGSQGVMLDRVGSNLDRAVLLGDLLRRSGYTVRLAHAQLAERRAAELIGKVRPIPDQRRISTNRNDLPPDRQRAIESLLPGHQQAMQQQIASSSSRVDEAKALIRSQAEQVYATVKEVVPRQDRDDKEAIAAMQDHWWVERKEGDRWIAMDVLLPDATMGSAAAESAAPVEWKDGAAAPAIADADWHSVEVSVVVERYENGATTESSVLTTVLRPAELLERPITLLHRPKPWPDSLPDPKTDPNALGNAAVAVKEWVPVLRVGRDSIVQSGFSDGGDVIADPFSSQRDISGAGGAGFMTGFAEALGGSEAPATSLTAEWIEYEVRVPGEPNQRLRRPVFDILGPANRAAKTEGFDANTNDRMIERYEALLSSTDILLAPCAFTGEFVTHLTTAGLVANKAAIKELSQESDAAQVRDQVSAILGKLDSWSPLPDLMLWRSNLGGQRSAWFVDRPNVLSYRMTRSAVNADRVAFRELIDIASNSIGVRRATDLDPFEVRLRQGVADTVAEMLAVGSELQGVANTASLFALTGPGPDRSKRLGPRDPESVKTLAWPEDVSARLAENIDAGYMAVVPTEPVTVEGRQRVGWWRVNPVSGETVGVMDNGYNAGLTEKEVQDLKIALENFLKKDAEAWARIRARARLPVPIGESVARDLAVRDVARELLRDLIRLGY